MPFQIIKRTDKDFAGVQMGNRKGWFGAQNVIRTEDAALANDIDHRFGNARRDGKEADVLVAEVNYRTTGNKFMVGISFDENGNVIRRQE